MPVYEVLFKLTPSGIFGLPDGDKIVVPATSDGTKRTIHSPPLDVRSRVVAGHGTLPEYRHETKAVTVDVSAGALRMVVNDNFVRVLADAEDAYAAFSASSELVDLISQTMSVQSGIRFAAEYLSLQDASGNPQSVRRPQSIRFFNATVYNTAEVQERINTAFDWTIRVDERGRKALLYFEHGCLLSEFADELPRLSAHAGFTWALAFLQLYKALTAILGEPGTDRDYQSRAGRLGLPGDFWTRRVKELYQVRNDEDVAHYSLKAPDGMALASRFAQASSAFKDAFAAHMHTLPKEHK